MDLSNVIRLADSGDVQSMIELGHYYSDFDNTEHMDIEKALFWMEKSAELDDIRGMLFTASLYNAYGEHLLNLDSTQLWDEAIRQMEKALFWAKKVICVGNDANDICFAEEICILAKLLLGRAYMHAGLAPDADEDKAIHYLQLAINYLKENYEIRKDGSCLNEAASDEFLFYLGCSLFNYMDHHIYLDDDDSVLMVKCLNRFAKNHNYADDYVGVAYYYLGRLYTFGVGCEKDYNKAVECYTIATTKCNFDCSSELSHFKKKLFGGYTYIE